MNFTIYKLIPRETTIKSGETTIPAVEYTLDELGEVTAPSTRDAFEGARNAFPLLARHRIALSHAKPFTPVVLN